MFVRGGRGICLTHRTGRIRSPATRLSASDATKGWCQNPKPRPMGRSVLVWSQASSRCRAACNSHVGIVRSRSRSSRGTRPPRRLGAGGAGQAQAGGGQGGQPGGGGQQHVAEYPSRTTGAGVGPAEVGPEEVGGVTVDLGAGEGIPHGTRASVLERFVLPKPFSGWGLRSSTLRSPHAGPRGNY